MELEHLTFSKNFAIGYRAAIAATTEEFSLDSSSDACAITVLSGSNGSGKTTLLRSLAGILPLRGGAVTLGGTDLARLYAAQQICYLPESLEFFRYLTPLQILESQCPSARELFLPAAEVLQIQLKKTFYWKLSKGNRQKVRFLLAYCEAARRKLALLDEPFSGFDIAAREAAMELLKKLFSSGSGRRLLISLHTEKIPEKWSDSSLGIFNGKIIKGPSFSSVYDAKNYFSSLAMN